MKPGFMIFIIFFQFMIIGSFGGLHSSYVSSKSILEDHSVQVIDLLLEAEVNSLKAFLNSYENIVELVFADSQINSVFNLKDGLDSYLVLNKSHESLEERISVFDEIVGYSVFDSEGKALYFSFDFEKENVSLSEKLEGFHAGEVFFSESVNDYVFVMTFPYYDSENNFEGGLRVLINAQVLFDNLVFKSEKGGEIYLVNREGSLISPSKYLGKDAIGRIFIDINRSDSCFEGVSVEEDLESLKNYVGMEVFELSSFIPQTDWCLFVDVSKKELIQKADSKLFSSIFVILIFMAILIALSLFVILFIFLSEDLFGSKIKKGASLK